MKKIYKILFLVGVGGNFPGVGNFPGDNFPGGTFPGGIFPGSIFPSTFNFYLKLCLNVNLQSNSNLTQKLEFKLLT